MSMMIATSKDPSVTIRFPSKVLAAAKEAAKKNGRSQNSEIVYRLAQSFGLADEPNPQTRTR